MAFQAPLNLPNMAAVLTDMWPSMSNVLAAPWKHVNLSSNSPSPRHSEARMVRAEESTTAPARLALPDCLETTSLQSLRFASPEYLAQRSTQGAFFLQGQKGLFGSPTLSPINPIRASGSRQYSTLSAFQLNRRKALPEINGFSQYRQQQRRTFFGGASQNILAHMEKTANNNPGSATAQTAFYSALLRANMPAIVVERYRSGRFATNASSEAIYLKALQRVGGTDAVGAAAGQNNLEGQNQNLTPEQLQAVGQAVAARNFGGQVGVAANKTGTGAKDAPLYVVVEETLGSSIFRWVKFIVYFSFFGYFSLLVLTAVLETTGMLKNVRGAQNNEAQPQQQTVRFSDVHGCNEAKEELQELVEFLSNPERFSALGGKLPKGVLLVGPPGTGKTLLARAVAGEAGVPFFYMSGSEFDEVYVGVGAKRVRDLFTQARGKAPAIIFIDELDAIGAKRNERDAAYVKQTLNQLLTELDGFSQSTGVIIIAATNYPKLLDKALTRPGRFDRKVEVGLPDVRGRIDILNHHMKNVQISTDVDASIIARGTPGFSGADLENLVNQAAIRASKNKQQKVTPFDLDWAKDKILMGAENRSRVISDEDKMMTAYHEAGHTLVSLFTPASTPLYKVTIVPRGIALGVTHSLPDMDIVSKNYSEYLADIDMCMGGRVAEELIYGPEKISSGISNDLQNATNIAFAMITQMGYSKKLGTVDLQSNYEQLSSETKQEIESEVRRILREAEERATKILTEKRKELELLTKALVEYETLSKEEIEKVLKGEKLEKLENLSKPPLVLPEPLTSTGGIPSPGGEPAASK